MNLELANTLATGIPVGVGQRAVCDCCNADVLPNEPLEVLVLFRGSSIEPVTGRCLHCARGEIKPETERSCWLVRGTVTPSIDAAGRSHVILSGAVVLDRTE